MSSESGRESREREPLSEAAKSSMKTSSIGATEDAVALINRIRPGSNTLVEPDLPGHGDLYTEADERPACGVATEVRVCGSCGEDHEIGATCDRWECPRCYKRAVLKATIRVTAKFAHYRDKYARGDELRFHRVIIVPPPEGEFSTTADPLDRFYKGSGDLLEAGGGYHGGVRIPHPYRHADEPAVRPDTDDRRLALVGGGDEDDEQGIWKHTLPDWSSDHIPDWAETQAKLSHEPHMHCYLVSESFWLPTPEIYEETGWVVKRLEPYDDEENHVSCFDVNDLGRSVMYALSHAGMYDGDKYRYFGALTNEPATVSQKQRMSRICRNYANHVLGLPTSSGMCSVDVSHASDDAAAVAGRGGGGSRASSDATDASGNGYEPCGGYFVHPRQVPTLIEKHADDWPEERIDRLRRKFGDKCE